MLLLTISPEIKKFTDHVFLSDLTRRQAVSFTEVIFHFLLFRNPAKDVLDRKSVV